MVEKANTFNTGREKKSPRVVKGKTVGNQKDGSP